MKSNVWQVFCHKQIVTDYADRSASVRIKAARSYAKRPRLLPLRNAACKSSDSVKADVVLRSIPVIYKVAGASPDPRNRIVLRLHSMDFLTTC
jgi:hypothetical protein